jgi:hypothetical protein
MTVPTMARGPAQHLPLDPTHDLVKRQQAGGVSALYLALALLAAIPYFLLVVDYRAATTAADKVALVVDHYASMYAVYLATYVLFGIAVGVLALALHDRLRADGPVLVRIGTLVGLLWAFALVASGLVFTYGMTTIEALAVSDRAQAVLTWQALEPVALALGGAGGELLGGLWVLLVSVVVLRGAVLPKLLGWLGVVIGVVGLTSVVPPLHDATVVFGLLQIVWFVWLGVILLKTKSMQVDDRLPAIT